MLYPIEWFAHSNFGGRFTAQLKNAGWDGIVVEGRADKACRINIVNDKVTIESANGIWGMDTWDNLGRNFPTGNAQIKIRRMGADRRWLYHPNPGRSLLRIGWKQEPPGSSPPWPRLSSSLCGFGGVFGSKNLKAISVIGTGKRTHSKSSRLSWKLGCGSGNFNGTWTIREEGMVGGMFFWINGSPAGANVTNNPILRNQCCSPCACACGSLRFLPQRLSSAFGQRGQQ